MIELKNIYKSFGLKHVLKGVDLFIPEGETFTIIGGSGHGKSVILKHIAGMLMPDMGNVFVDGQNLSCLKNTELFQLQQKFGILFQGAALFDSLTVGENVGFGLKWILKLPPKEIDKIVEEKLEMVDLDKTVANIKPAELSGGMKKRVGLARAIAYDPKYILYDEPTTGLDPITSDVINKLILRLKQELKITAVAITHDMKSAYYISDRIAMLYEGRIIEQGRPSEIKNTRKENVRRFIDGVSD
ncbi:MAG: ABC transporter ATP-binding protein [bacterium]|nr:ABC transporter ATP-binding protein [bacterium]